MGVHNALVNAFIITNDYSMTITATHEVDNHNYTMNVICLTHLPANMYVGVTTVDG